MSLIGIASHLLQNHITLLMQVLKVFAQHDTFGIKLEIDKKFLDYAYKSAETVASGSAESGAASEAEMQAAKTAAAVKEQAKASRRAAEAKTKAKAMAKAKAKAKAMASEKQERRLLAEAAKVAKAAAEAEAEAEAEVNTLKGAKNPLKTKAVEEAAKARPLAQARSFLSIDLCACHASNTQSPHPLPLRTGASGVEEGSDYDG